MDLGSSTELITLKPWCTGKQLPLGFSVFDQKKFMKKKLHKQQAPSCRLDKLQAVGYYRTY